MRSKIVLLKCLFFAITAPPVFSQSKATKEVITAVENFRELIINPDSAQLASVLDDRLSYGHSGGKIETKAACIYTLTSGTSIFVNSTLSAPTIKIFGKTAIVRHILEADTNDEGKQPAVVKLSVLMVWCQQKNAWRLVSRQAVKLK
jgi:ketosteroid isomerase-like protein